MSRNKSRMKNEMSRKAGFTLLEIMIVVAIISLLAAIAIPNFLKARATSQQNACINNLRQLDGAKQQWALESHAGANGAPGSTDVQPYLGRGSSGLLPYCPQDSTKVFTTSYLLDIVSKPPSCNINGTGQNDPNTPHALPPGAK